MIAETPRIPPQSIQAEASVLGALMLDSARVPKVAAIIRAEDFYRPAHQTIYSVLVDMSQAGKPVDLVMLREELERRSQLQAVGGVEYLVALVQGVPTSANAEHYATIVADHAARRAAIIYHTQAAADAWDPMSTVETGRHHLVRLADVEPQPVRWLHPYRIALGKLTVIAGMPGLGKSFLTLDYAARVSRGDGFSDCPASTSKPGGAVLLSAEDDLSDTIRPRLDAAGADVERIVAMTFPAFNLSDHLSVLESAIGQVDNCKVVVVDPISAYLGGADSHNNAEVRALLAPLAELAARHRVAVLAVSHLNKGNGEALNRVMGSLAFVAAARAAYVVVKDQADPARRLFLPAKNNIGIDDTGLAFRLDGNPIPHIEWEHLPVRISADEAITPPERHRGPAPENRDEAAAWLRDVLAGGPQPAEHLYAEADKVGITKGTLRRAKEVAGVTARKQSFDGPWTWQLPGHTPPPESAFSQGAHQGAQRPLSPTI